MPTVPIRSNSGQGNIGSAGWTFVAYRYPSVVFNGARTASSAFTPSNGLSWQMNHVEQGGLQVVSNAGVSAAPTPTGTPDRIDFNLTFPATDFDDIEDDDKVGFMLGSGSQYHNGTRRWAFTYAGPPVSYAAEVVRDELDYEFYAVARSVRWPLSISSFTPSAPNPIVRFQFVFPGDSVQTTTSISLDSAIGGFEYYRGGPVAYTAPDGEPFTVRIRAIDSFGAVSNWAYVTMAGVAGVAKPRFGSILDAAGVLYSAVNDGDNVQIYRFPNGAASRQSLAVIPNAKNPSYAYDKRKNRHFVSYEDRSDGAQKMVYGLNSGREFTV